MTIELQFEKRMCTCEICKPTETGNHYGPPCPRPIQRILQYRTRPDNSGFVGVRPHWSEWQDVPEVDEEETA